MAPRANNQSVIQIAVALVLLLAVLVLTGWWLNIRPLMSVLPAFPTMRANTALCLGLSAVATWLSRSRKIAKRNAPIIWILAAAIALTAGVTALEYLLSWNAGLDELLFRDPEHLGTSSPPGRMAPATTVCFLMLSAAILLLDNRPRLSHALTLATSFIGLVSLIGFLYNLPTLYGAGRYTSLALHTTIGFLLMSLALLACRPDRGLTALLLEARTHKSALDFLVLGAIVLPIGLGSLSLWGQRMGLYGSEFTLALFSVFLIVLTVAWVWITGAARLKVETAFRDSEERLRTLADNIPNLAWMADTDGNVFWYNKRWHEYTGKSLQEMKDWGWQSIHDPDMLPLVVENWKAAISSGEPFEMVFPLRGADNVYRPFLTRIQPVTGDDGQIVRWLGTNTDISAERAAQEELRKANRHLEEFAYVSSHDLQEPIRSVSLYSQLLVRDLGGKLDDSAREYARAMQASLKLLEQMIRGLLVFSRTIASDGTEQLETADLNVCVENSLRALAALVADTSAVVTWDALPTVIGDESQLTQVFQNLISNSLKYRNPHAPPAVQIRALEQQGSWLICLEDNGIGFEQQFAERIFGLFKRLHRDRYPGTGLGLTLCRRTVERYGGRMWAEGQPGVGARFYFLLSAAPKNAQDPVAA